jgi:putative peptide zinc metalloprotease protein
MSSPQDSEKEQPKKPMLLPSFRPDLELFRGPPESDGSPTYNIFDPVKVKYYKISWSEALVMQLMRPGMTLEALVHGIEAHSTLKVTPQEVMSFFEQAKRLDLLAIVKPSDVVIKEAEKAETDPLMWLLMHYLLIRVPVFRPDAFLARTLKYVTPLWSRPALIFYAIVTIIGVFLLLSQFDEFLHTFTYFFNFEGLIVYAVAILFVKTVHELAHAYTAKYYGIHVPTIGIAFIVLWPVFYTDVTHSWSLSSRRQRIAISAAGVAAEMVLAGLCTLGWALTSPGLLHSVFFVISSATWITSLFINLNPALRYDGYYLLSDIWGIDNLQPRAFAMARWKLREWLLGIYIPPPEERVSDKRMVAMIVYSLYTWIYRVFLYTAIAIFIYYKFTKALGLFLFLVEIGIFFVWPILWEIYDLNRVKPYLTANRRMFFTALALSLLAFWLIVPLPHTLTFSAVTIPSKDEIIYAPASSVIDKIYVKRGDSVTVGQPLIKLSSKFLDDKITDLQLAQKIAEKEVRILSLKDEDRPFLAQKRAELAKIHEDLAVALNTRSYFIIKSQFEGKVYAWDENLKPGQFVTKDQAFGKIADTKLVDAVFFVPEDQFGLIDQNKEVKFKQLLPPESFNAKIKTIDPIRTEILIYPGLASVNQGPLPVNEDPSGKLHVLEAYYPIQIALEDQKVPLKYGLIGNVEVEGPWQSHLVTFIQRTLSLFWRQSGF